MRGELGLDGPQQPHLGSDFSGQLLERHRRVIAVQLKSRRRGRLPFPGPRRALLLVRRRGDQPGELGRAGGRQLAGIGVAFQHRHVGRAQVTGQRRHRQQLPDQVLDPHLVRGGVLGQPVTRPDPPVQRRRLRACQLERLQPARVGQRQPGQRLRVDPIRLHVPAQEPA